MLWDYSFKFSFIGDTFVGKTHLMYSLANTCPHANILHPTIGVDYHSIQKKIYYKDNLYNIKLILWDTAGQEQYNSIIKTYLKNVTVICIVFDMSQPFYHNTINKWIEYILPHKHSNTQLVLIGNKIDLCDEQTNFNPKDYCFPFYEVSAKHRINTDYLIENICVHILNKINNNTIAKYNYNLVGIKVNNTLTNNYINLNMENNTNANDNDNNCCILL